MDDFIIIVVCVCVCVILAFIIPIIYFFIKQYLEEKKQKIYEEKLFESNISAIDDMSGIEFELFCKILFEKQGYSVELTKASGDYGVDLIINKDNFIKVGQCKRYSDKVSLSAVQEIAAGMAFYGANEGFIITNNFFTKPAINLAEANNIELIDRHALVDLICEIKKISTIDFLPKELEKPKKEIEKKENEPTLAEINNQHNAFLNFSYKAIDRIISAYSNEDYEKVKSIILEVESSSSGSKEDKISLHFFYQHTADILYAMRFINDKAIDDCLILCDKDIEILKTENLLPETTITTLTRKSIILEKQNKILDAIEVCNFAIKHNYLDNKKPFSIRKARIEKKLNK